MGGLYVNPYVNSKYETTYQTEARIPARNFTSAFFEWEKALKENICSQL